jgi:aminoglycoside phosphotransferase family enzyme/predicted kinase
MSSEVVSFLLDPAAYGGGVKEVGHVETASSHVFLAGDRAFKLKRDLRLPHADYSTLERRRRCCEREVELNRRTAPTIYLGTVPVMRAASGALALGGPGTVVDWLVEMVRFDQGARFDALAAREALSPTVLGAAGRAVAALHTMAARRPDHGGVAGLRAIIDENAPLSAPLLADSLEALKQHAMLLDVRRADGWVREGHGDLCLRNIVLHDGRPVLFGAVEFDDGLSCVDVLHELAALVTELLHRELLEHANAVLNAWMERMRQYDALPVLPLFLSARAATQARLLDAAGQRDEAQALIAAALRYVQPGTGAIVAIGGLSGAGKTTLSRRVAARIGQPPGALLLRAEAARKRLFGVADDARQQPAYNPSVARSIYRLIAREAHDVARAGYVAIVDATLGLDEWRLDIRRSADRAGVPLVGVWLDAPVDVLERRVRESRGEAGEAALRVLRQQRQASVAPADWTRIDATLEPDDVVAAAMAAWTAAQAGA